MKKEKRKRREMSIRQQFNSFLIICPSNNIFLDQYQSNIQIIENTYKIKVVATAFNFSQTIFN